MVYRSYIGVAATLVLWAAGLAAAVVVGSLLLAVDGSLRWLGLPLLLLMLRGDGLSCGRRGCGVGGERLRRHWPSP